MNKLIFGLLALCSLSTFADLSELAKKIEIKKCKKELFNEYRGADFYPYIRYLQAQESDNSIHVFAIYDPQSAEPSEVVKMIKLNTKKCKRY